MRWENTVTIDAPTNRVWELTTDVENLPSITPTMRRVVRLDDGPLHEGSQAKIWQPAQSPAIWTVTRLEPAREFTWQTRRLGVTMTGRHLLDGDDVSCRNTLVLELSGPGAKLLGALLGKTFAKALATENAGLQRAATS
ncbi:SRPBCC family protein [Hamadaea sp. NPDC051192]|uniref:SRPBCC family protein n=1 Tax=Hamadaea sp. NPDC051192 TaxID=3154940 RepID=UPI003414595B